MFGLPGGIQGDSEKLKQFKLAIFPELYAAFEFCKLRLNIHTWKFIDVQCTHLRLQLQ
jgi:hypothetical protein